MTPSRKENFEFTKKISLAKSVSVANYHRLTLDALNEVESLASSMQFIPPTHMLTKAEHIRKLTAAIANYTLMANWLTTHMNNSEYYNEP